MSPAHSSGGQTLAPQAILPSPSPLGAAGLKPGVGSARGFLYPLLVAADAGGRRRTVAPTR